MVMRKVMIASLVAGLMVGQQAKAALLDAVKAAVYPIGSCATVGAIATVVGATEIFKARSSATSLMCLGAALAGLPAVFYTAGKQSACFSNNKQKNIITLATTAACFVGIGYLSYRALRDLSTQDIADLVNHSRGYR